MTTYWAFNCTKQTLLASDLELTETGWARMKGLIGRGKRDFPEGHGLWVFPSQGIHTIGMAFAIDAIYLDAGYRVIRTYEALAPFRIASVQLSAQSVIELPAGTLSRSQTQVGDLLQISVAEADAYSQCGRFLIPKIQNTGPDRAARASKAIGLKDDLESRHILPRNQGEV